jgi:hypothetical protein
MPFNPMEYIWNNLQKVEDGLYASYTREDLDFLWHVGFVDTKKFSIEEWIESFTDSLRPDGKYYVTKEQFLAKEKFRYNGIIHSPFDAMKINEGKYTDEGLEELIERSLKPSIDYPPEELNKFFNDFKKKYRDPADSLIRMDHAAKKEIWDLVDQNPSALRCLEFIYDEVLFAAAWGDQPGSQGPSQTTSQKEVAKVEASVFMSTPSNKTEELGKKFKKLEATKEKLQEETEDSKPTVDLKSVMRRRKGFRG